MSIKINFILSFSNMIRLSCIARISNYIYKRMDEEKFVVFNFALLFYSIYLFLTFGFIAICFLFIVNFKLIISKYLGINNFNFFSPINYVIKISLKLFTILYLPPIHIPFFYINYFVSFTTFQILFSFQIFGYKYLILFKFCCSQVTTKS